MAHSKTIRRRERQDMQTKLGSMPRLAAGVVCAFAGVAMATPVVTTFNLSNHPDGDASPPSYGLRIDGMGGSQTVVFSFVDVQLVVTDDTADGGDISMNISGLVEGGEVSGNAFADPQMYNLNFDYVANVENFSGGWRVVGVNNVLNTGTLSPVMGGDAEDVFTITDNNNNAFIFAPDGHRLAGDNTSWVGRGWLTTNLGGGDSPGTQDWLFVGTPIPAPGSAALLALGGIAAATRRR